MDLGNIFAHELPTRLKDPSHGLRSMFVFDVSGDDGGVWSIDFRDGTVVALHGPPGEAPADCTVGLISADMREVLRDPERSGAFLIRGKIRVTGDNNHALRFFQYLGMSHG